MASNYSLSAYMNNLQMEEAARQREKELLYMQQKDAQDKAYQSSRDLMNKWAREDELALEHERRMEGIREGNRPMDERLAFEEAKWLTERYNIHVPPGTTRAEIEEMYPGKLSEMDAALREEELARAASSTAESNLAKNRAEFGNEWTTDVRGQYNAMRGPDGQTNPMGVSYDAKPQQDRYATDIAAGFGTGDLRFNASALKGQEMSLLDAEQSADIGKREAFAREREAGINIDPTQERVALINQATQLAVSRMYTKETTEQEKVKMYDQLGLFVDGKGEPTIMNRAAVKDANIKMQSEIRAIQGMLQGTEKQLDKMLLIIANPEVPLRIREEIAGGLIAGYGKEDKAAETAIMEFMEAPTAANAKKIGIIYKSAGTVAVAAQGAFNRGMTAIEKLSEGPVEIMPMSDRVAMGIADYYKGSLVLAAPDIYRYKQTGEIPSYLQGSGVAPLGDTPRKVMTQAEYERFQSVENASPSSLEMALTRNGYTMEDYKAFSGKDTPVKVTTEEEQTGQGDWFDPTYAGDTPKPTGNGQASWRRNTGGAP